jgi:hypothetical protein
MRRKRRKKGREMYRIKRKKRVHGRQRRRLREYGASRREG